MKNILIIVFLITIKSTLLSQKIDSSSNFKYQINPKLAQIYKSNSIHNNNRIKHNIIWEEFENTTYVNPWLGFNIDSQKFNAEYFWENNKLIIIGHFGDPDQYAPTIYIIINKSSFELSFTINSGDSIFSLNAKKNPINKIVVPIKKVSFSLSKTPTKTNMDNMIAYIDFETYEYYKFSKINRQAYRKLKTKIIGFFPIYFLEVCEG